MFLSLRRDRDPFYYDPFRHYSSLRREMDDLLTPAMQVLQQMTPRVVAPKGDSYEFKVDVKNFAPEELTVKVVDNNVVIEGKHEERQDDQGFISRHFVRRYALAEDVKKDTIICNLSSDGFLTVSVPRAIEAPKDNERNVPINFTGQPAVKENNAGAGDNQMQQ